MDESELLWDDSLKNSAEAEKGNFEGNFWKWEVRQILNSILLDKNKFIFLVPYIARLVYTLQNVKHTQESPQKSRQILKKKSYLLGGLQQN